MTLIGKKAKWVIFDDIEDIIDTRVLGIDWSHDEQAGVVVYGQKAVDNFIIIDEVRPLISRDLERDLIAVGLIKKPSQPNKQPEWARHNQAPRSARKRR
jgi:hypothetical protein